MDLSVDLNKQPYPFNGRGYNGYLDRQMVADLNAVTFNIFNHPGVNNGGYTQSIAPQPAPNLKQRPAVKRLPSAY